MEYLEVISALINNDYSRTTVIIILSFGYVFIIFFKKNNVKQIQSEIFNINKELTKISKETEKRLEKLEHKIENHDKILDRELTELKANMEWIIKLLEGKFMTKK